MNGGVAAKAANDNKPHPGSRKRKRGLAPRKTKMPVVEEPIESVPQTQLIEVKAAVSVQNGYGPTDEEMLPLCDLCQTAVEADMLVNLTTNVVMRQTLASFWKLPLQDIEEKPVNACVQCVFKINAHNEVTRSLQIRLHRLTNGQIKNAGHNQTQYENICAISNENKHVLAQSTPKPHAVISSPTHEIAGDMHAEETNAWLTPEKKNTSGSSTLTLDVSITPPAYSPIEASCSAEQHEQTPPRENSATYTVEVEPVTPVKDQVDAEVAIETNHHKQADEVHLAETEHRDMPLPPPRTPTPIEIAIPPATTVTATTINTLTPSTKEFCALPNATPSLDYNSRSDSLQSLHINQSMLEVYCEHSESALVTESGGRINNYQRRHSTPATLSCAHCARSFVRKNHFAKHRRRCSARARYAKSRIEIEASAKEDAICAADTAAEEVHTVVRQRVFHCTECAVTVENIAKLREHKRIHLSRYYCETCGQEFTTWYDYEFHCVECKAKQEALKTAVATESTEERPTTPAWAGRMTRSRSHAVAKSVVSVATTTLPNAVNGVNNADDEDDDDDVSEVDTMYTKRMRATGDWVDNHSNSSSYLSLCDTQLYEYDEDLQDYDLYLLDRLKAEIHACALSCFMPHCKYYADNLLAIMLHDYKLHFKSSWFYCKKCGGIFTSKVHLDYHLDRQNGGRFICFKCGEVFEFQNQLKRHLVRHTKCINYRCNYCKFEFLTKTELLQHCNYEQHDPNGERKLICIDATMTIVNATPPALPYVRGVYTVKMLDMKLPRMPSKRPMTLPGHKPYRRHIGEVQFKNQTNPNCWGWK